MDIQSAYIGLENIASASIRMATPLLIAALGEVIAERSGVINIGLEGMILTGAFFGMIGSYFASNAFTGLMFAALSGLIMALIFAFLTISLKTDQIVAGAGLNLLALGITGLTYRKIFGTTGAALTVATFGEIKIPMLSKLPILGKALFSQNILVYFVLTLVAVEMLYLFHTYQGLAILACGEHPKAADTQGFNVGRIRHKCILICGALAGIAGAYLSLAHSNTFIEGMSAGRGFIALAIVIFGKWHPVKSLFAALLFGLANAMQFQLQAFGLNLPYQLFLMLPYILTILVLAGFAGGAKAPQALAVPYRRE